MLRAAGAIELRGQFEMRRGEPQPLAADVVHVSEHRRDCARVTAGRLCPPSLRIQMLEDELVHPVIDGIGLEQRLAKIRGGQSSGTSHGLLLASLVGHRD